jgi:AAHS family 4-hydroxybenzoate transporter-like MFS transporter
VSERTVHSLDNLIDEAPWSRYHTGLVLMTALTIVFDGIDNQLFGVVMPAVMSEWHVSRSTVAPVVSAGYLGMMIGGALGGLAGDRAGRRTALLTSVVLFGAMTLLASFARDVSTLGWLRLLAGIGLGGAMPNAAALAAEYAPRRVRPVAVTATIVCVPLGAMLAGLIGARFLMTVGWRALFLVGGLVPLVSAAGLWRLLPESPHFLAGRARRRGELHTFLRRIGRPISQDVELAVAAGAARGSIADLFTATLRQDTLALWVAFFSCQLAVYLGFAWLPTLLTGAGFALSVSSTGIAAFNLGGVAGAVSGALLITRTGSRVAMLAMAGGAIAGAIALMVSPLTPLATTRLLVLLTLTGGLINAVQTTMYALATNVYPARIRAIGVGTAIAVGRLGAITSGYTGAWTIGAAGALSYFGMMGVAMTVCAVALAVVRAHISRMLGFRTANG